MSIEFPLANYPSGNFQSPWRSIPDAATEVKVAVARCTSSAPTTWPNPATEIDLTIELSLDGGATIAAQASHGALPGGIMKGLHEPDASFSKIGFKLKPGFTNRSVRLTIDIRGGPIRTQGSIEIL